MQFDNSLVTVEIPTPPCQNSPFTRHRALQEVCKDNGIEFECHPGFPSVWKSSAARMWPMKSFFVRRLRYLLYPIHS